MSNDYRLQDVSLLEAGDAYQAHDLKYSRDQWREHYRKAVFEKAEVEEELRYLKKLLQGTTVGDYNMLEIETIVRNVRPHLEKQQRDHGRHSKYLHDWILDLQHEIKALKKSRNRALELARKLGAELDDMEFVDA